MEGKQGKVPSESEVPLETSPDSTGRNTSTVTPDESKTTETPPPMFEVKGSILKSKSSYPPGGSNEDEHPSSISPPKSAPMSRNQSFADSSDFNTPDSSAGGTPGSYKKQESLGKKLKNLRRGSMLRSKGKNRRDHFSHLLMKRKIRAAMERSLGPRFSGRAATESGAESGAESDFDQEAATKCISHYGTLRKEVERDMLEEEDTGKVREAKLMLKEYYIYAKKAVWNLSVEVRMENLTYSVPISSEAGKVMTVYNSSFLYPVYKFFQRTWRGEKKKPSRIGTKKVLDDINLVLKPGKMYLLLGPPTCGKTTLLRAITGHLHPDKKDKLEGTIKYNGRTFKVCHVQRSAPIVCIRSSMGLYVHSDRLTN
jgi:hypothetical protein